MRETVIASKAVRQPLTAARRARGVALYNLIVTVFPFPPSHADTASLFIPVCVGNSDCSVAVRWSNTVDALVIAEVTVLRTATPTPPVCTLTAVHSLLRVCYTEDAVALCWPRTTDAAVVTTAHIKIAASLTPVSFADALPALIAEGIFLTCYAVFGCGPIALPVFA
jgi:hypothetical protein